MIVSTPFKNANPTGIRDCRTAPSTPVNRRDSALWVRTPEDDEEGHGEGDEEDVGMVLTPVPKTPAPEAIARFAADVTPASSEGAESVAAREELLQRTCPPVNASSVHQALGEGILAREKDESVLQRLMAARRRSLQYAPKVGSPLSKTWK